MPDLVGIVDLAEGSVGLCDECDLNDTETCDCDCYDCVEVCDDSDTLDSEEA